VVYMTAACTAPAHAAYREVKPDKETCRRSRTSPLPSIRHAATSLPPYLSHTRRDRFGQRCAIGRPADLDLADGAGGEGSANGISSPCMVTWGRPCLRGTESLRPRLQGLYSCSTPGAGCGLRRDRQSRRSRSTSDAHHPFPREIRPDTCYASDPAPCPTLSLLRRYHVTDGSAPTRVPPSSLID